MRCTKNLYRYDTDRWGELRSRLIAKSNHKCRACLGKFPEGMLTLHHIVPRSKGGKDSPRNLICLCAPCHNWIEERIEDFPTRSSIHGSRESVDVKDTSQVVTPNGDWRAVVYGGARWDYLSQWQGRGLTKT